MTTEKTSLNQSIYTNKQIKDLLPGDIILHPIYRSDGLMLIKKYKVLSASIIRIIQKHTPTSMSVLVAPSQDNLTEFVQSKFYHHPKFREDLQAITMAYNKHTSVSINMSSSIEDIAPDHHTDENKLAKSTIHEPPYFQSILAEHPLWENLDKNLESQHLKDRAHHIKKHILDFISNDKIFIELFDTIKSYNDILFIHTINTTCIALMIGLTLEMSDDDLLDLALAALFLNIGITEMSQDEFKAFLKADHATIEAIRKHLEAFSRITLKSPHLRKKSIVYGILDHHEFYNGKGLPNGKKADEISLIGRIVLIATNYDDIVGGYNYTTGLTPVEALKIIYENSENKYDQKILDVFMHRTLFLKLGHYIMFLNHLKGKIIGFEDYLNAPHLPILKLEDGRIINLLSDTLYN